LLGALTIRSPGRDWLGAAAALLLLRCLLDRDAGGHPGAGAIEQPLAELGVPQRLALALGAAGPRARPAQIRRGAGELLLYVGVVEELLDLGLNGLKRRHRR
jgi:hypothetical protein